VSAWLFDQPVHGDGRAEHDGGVDERDADHRQQVQVKTFGQGGDQFAIDAAAQRGQSGVRAAIAAASVALTTPVAAGLGVA
jgi:hypothetical protein